MYNSFIDVLKKGYVTIQLYMYMYNFIGLLTATERKKRIIKSTIILYICSIGI